MKKFTPSTNQLAFSFDSVVETTTSNPFSLVAMNYFADRLHAKIDMMRVNSALEKKVSLVIKQDDKDIIVAALDGSKESLSTQQLASLEVVAEMVKTADKKIFLSYEQVNDLFNAVSH